MKRVRPVGEHLRVIICLQKNGVAALEMLDNVLTRGSNICKYTDTYFVTFDDKALRIMGIMIFREGRNSQISYFDRFVRSERPIERTEKRKVGFA